MSIKQLTNWSTNQKRARQEPSAYSSWRKSEEFHSLQDSVAYSSRSSLATLNSVFRGPFERFLENLETLIFAPAYR